MNAIPLISDEIIQKAQAGDQEAFGEIYESYIAAVYRFILFRCGEEKSAEKLAEETFLKIWRALKKFHAGGRLSFSVWVFQAAGEVVHRFLEEARKSKLTKKKRELPGDVTPETSEYHDLFEAFADLPDTQAEAIVLKYFCSLPNQEIAILLEKTEGAVRILQSRGLKRLRELLEETPLPS